jgi:hypothetical protein
MIALVAEAEKHRPGTRRSQAKRLRSNRARLAALGAIFLLVLAIPSVAKDKNKTRRAIESSENITSALWSNPTDITSRDLFYGSGGKSHGPHTTFTFVKEDLNGTNPKFDVRDENGIKWKIKLGAEAEPETAASRLLWSVGYFTNEDYFLSDLRVENMQPLKRGQNLIGADGTMHNVRLKRYLKGEKKIGNWGWHNNPFTGTREFNGLRVMMALVNNWDLKDQNNSIYEEKDDGQDPSWHYMVSDLGGSFGTTGLSFPNSHSKGNLPAYSHSKFIKRVRGERVDFNVPTRPNLWHLVDPKEFTSRMRLRWIGHDIPRADARWIGHLLSQLSRDQIRQAFRAAGYSPKEVEQFADVMEERINELNKL